MLQNKKSQTGFTLIEMMLVVAIIGVLAAMAMPQFSEAQEAARTARVQADLRIIETAIVMYESDNGTAPTAITDLTTAPAAGRKPYLRSIPVAPSGSVRITPGGVADDATTVSDGVYGINADGRAVFGKNGGTMYPVEDVR